MRILTKLLLTATVLAVSLATHSQEATSATLITNARIFDGVNEGRVAGDVLIENNLIRQDGADLQAPEDALVIDAGGRTLMPGLSDMHWHTALAEFPLTSLFSGDAFEVGIRMTLAAPKTLMRGFTTVRDMGGNAFSLKKLIDAGVVVGPRILPAGPMISQTGGHFDYRLPNEIPDGAVTLTYWERVGMHAVGSQARS